MSGDALAALPAPPLRVVFMGTPEFAATILGGLLDGPDQVVGVFSRPDAKRGRGMKLVRPPVAELAAAHDIPIAQPRGWKNGEALQQLERWAPDLVVVAAYGRLLPQAALDAPAFGCINVHASLLPRWRGADPITRSILEGDEETGVTIMQMVLEMDAGASLLQSRTPIRDDDTGAALEDRLAALGRDALADALAQWRAGELRATPQDPTQVTVAPMLQKQDGRVDWAASAARIERSVRAFIPWPGASTTSGGQPLKIWGARPATAAANGLPGEVLQVDREGVMVAAGEGAVRLTEVQAAGKKRMPAGDWARGARITAGSRLGD